MTACNEDDGSTTALSSPAAPRAAHDGGIVWTRLDPHDDDETADPRFPTTTSSASAIRWLDARRVWPPRGWPWVRLRMWILLQFAVMLVTEAWYVVITAEQALQASAHANAKPARARADADPTRLAASPMMSIEFVEVGGGERTRLTQKALITLVYVVAGAHLVQLVITVCGLVAAVTYRVSGFRAFTYTTTVQAIVWYLWSAVGRLELDRLLVFLVTMVFMYCFSRYISDLEANKRSSSLYTDLGEPPDAPPTHTFAFNNRFDEAYASSPRELEDGRPGRETVAQSA
ncbi:hypothetical protein H9P43_008394 [Blastocladiella emersonii ATCC 22665]|nr:hypothetical protein H9P43_008394 [Blastocladiella emersonii ATCC 22665]